MPWTSTGWVAAALSITCGEGQRFEAVFNRLMGEAPVGAICIYDERRLSPQVIESAAATHPVLVHGTPPISARLWTDGTQIVCTITDRGTSWGDPFSGYLPAHGFDLSHGGMGLWLARKLWDHVDVLPGADGLTVRLSSRLR